jgi:hypothetical protein
MDFANLTAEEIDALDGHRREAWYAFRNGNIEKANAILEAYGDKPARVETATKARRGSKAD